MISTTSQFYRKRPNLYMKSVVIWGTLSLGKKRLRETGSSETHVRQFEKEVREAFDLDPRNQDQNMRTIRAKWFTVIEDAG